MHPIVQALHDIQEDELPSAYVADLLGLHRSNVVRLIEGGLIEARSLNGDAKNKRYRVTKEAVLRYLVRHTTGNKDHLLESIRALFPRSGALPIPAPTNRLTFGQPPAAKAKPVTPAATQLDLFPQA